MKLPLLLLVFIPLTIATSKKTDKDLKLFCSKGCPYLESMGNAKISFKKLDEQCKKDPKVPKFLCGKRPDQEAIEIMEKRTWPELCKAACGK